MATVHVVGEDMSRRGSDNGWTGDLGDLGTDGSWWCSKEGMGILIPRSRTRRFISVSEGVTWLECQ